MKKPHLFIISLAIILAVSCVAAFGQVKVLEGWSVLTPGSGEVVDLSKLVERETAESIKEMAANTSVEVRFQPEFRSEANQFLRALKQIVEKTQVILSPLRVEGFRYYLFQMPDPPQNYKVLFPKQGELFVFGRAFETRKEIEFDCFTNWNFCNSIYFVLSHEIIHPALRDLVLDARWFEEGLGNYVGFEVARQISPALIPYARELSVKSSLNNSSFQNTLFGWEQHGNNAFWKSRKRKDKIINNSRQETYDLAQQFVTTIIAESKKKGIIDPLRVLLESLQKFRDKNGRGAKTVEILALIETELRVDSKQLSQLSEQERVKMVAEATESLLQTKDDSRFNVPERFYSILVINNLPEIDVSDECLDYLLKLAFEERAIEWPRYYPSLALVSRIDQSNFEARLENFRASTVNLKSTSLKAMKDELKKMSAKAN